MAIQTKRQFCEEVLRDYYGGDLSSDNQRVMREVLIMFYELIPFFAKKNAFENSQLDGALYVNGQLIISKLYTNIETDPDRNEKYIDLTSLPIALPKNMGVHEVSAPHQNYAIPFLIQQNGQASLMGSLPGGKLPNKCYPEGTRLYFKNLKASITKVLVKLAGAVSETLDFDSPVGILQEFMDEAKEKVLARFRAGDTKPKDTVNDGNS